MKKILLIAGATAFALIAVTGVSWGAQRALAKHQTHTSQVTGAVRSVVLDVDTGDVSLVRATRGVTVSDSLHWSLRKPRVEQEVRGGVLTVKARCHGGVLLLSDCSTNLRVALPDGVPVRVRTNVGDVSGRGLVTGHLDAATDVGDVRLALAQRPVRLQAASNVGDVSLDVPRATYVVDTGADVGDEHVTGVVQDERAPLSIHAVTDVGDVAVRGH